MKVLFTGNIDNIAYSCAKFTRWLGEEADVLVSTAEQEVSHPFWEDPEEVAAPIMQIFNRRRGLQTPMSLFDLRRTFKQYDVVVSMGMMSIAAYLLSRHYVAVALGADMKELVFEKTPRGWLMDSAFRRADRLYYNDADHLPAVTQKGYDAARYFPIPVDVEKYHPPVAKRDNAELTLFHGASLSWSLEWTRKKEIHSKPLKRNDIFFKGLSRYVVGGRKVKVVVPLWGPDKERVVPLCRELGIEHCIDFVPPQTKPQLLAMYQGVDIVVDQFNMPRLGYNALEALSCGAPVLGYYSEELQRACYPELPPVFKAGNEEEVAACLEQLGDEAVRRQAGEAGRQWILDHHHWQPIMEELLGQCRALAHGIAA